jgi:hypothetical protein
MLGHPMLNVARVQFESLSHVCLMKPMSLVPFSMKPVILISSAFTTKMRMEFMMFLRFASIECMKLVVLVFLFFAVMIRVIAVISTVISIGGISKGVVIVSASPIIIAFRGTAESRQGNEQQH